MTLSAYLRAAGMVGYDVKTALLMPPGVIYDALALTKRKDGEKHGG